MIPATRQPVKASTDWYVLTEDVGTTLRITNRLILGESPEGELALNHRDSSRQWVCLKVLEDGSLRLQHLKNQTTTPSGPASGGSALKAPLTLRAGTRIALPNNSLLISRHFEGEDESGELVLIAAPAREDSPVERPPAQARAAKDKAASRRSRRIQVSAQGRIGAGLSANQPVLDTSHFRPQAPRRLEEARAWHLEQFIGSQLEPPLDKAPVAEAATSDTEAALVPVAAEFPVTDEFPSAAEEFTEMLAAPIDLPEVRAAEDKAEDNNDTTLLVTEPLDRLTPEPLAEVPQERRRSYSDAFGGIMIFAMLSVAINAWLRDTVQQESIPALPGEALVMLPPPEERVQVPPPEPAANPAAVETAPGARAQRATDALLASVREAISSGDGEDRSLWEFAVQSCSVVLAQEPDNVQARALMTEARQRLAALDLAALENAPKETATVTTLEAGQEQQAPTKVSEAVEADPGPTRPLRDENTGEPVLSDAQRSRLALAKARLDRGQLFSPQTGGVPLILDVLKESPNATEAMNLLDAVANGLVTEAEDAYAAGDAYLARNILEEVFAFHPDHKLSKERWVAWTNSSPQPTPSAAIVSDNAR